MLLGDDFEIRRNPRTKTVTANNSKPKIPWKEGIRHPSQIERPWYVWHGPSKGLRVGGDRDASDSEEEADRVVGLSHVVL